MISIKYLDSGEREFKNQLDSLLFTNEELDVDLVNTVSSIVLDVKRRGDRAVLDHTNRYDNRNARLSDLEVPMERINNAINEIPQQLRQALDKSAVRIQSFHERQKSESWSYTDEEGTLLGQQVIPISRVGVYVPGGKAAYPSSVLMNVIPAKVAGVDEVIMVVPAPHDELGPSVLAAAQIAGVDRLFSIGGAQAVAALAYGTETIPKVDKIVGPGNRYVAEAKRQVFGVVGIDMIAGPSEVLVLCDGRTDPNWVAIDLCAQAEHDEDARAILICTESGYINEVKKCIERLLPELDRADIITTSLEKKGIFIKVKDINEAIDIINEVAPEHLELSIAEPQVVSGKIKHAGAIFMGRYTAEVLGDYCAGPNHVLPTLGTARFSSPLGVYDFQKRTSLIMCNEESATDLATTASTIAKSEGFTAHALSAKLRINKK